MKEEIEKQQSSECDSSGRLCTDSDEIASTCMNAHVYIRVCMPCVNDFLPASSSSGIATT